MITAPALTAEQRVDMERHDVVRLAGDLLWKHRPDLPTDVVRENVAAVLLASCHKQARWLG